MYVTIEKDVSIESALARIETCIIEVAAWMARNDLKLNAERSQAILFKPLKHCVNKQLAVVLLFSLHQKSVFEAIWQELPLLFTSERRHAKFPKKKCYSHF